MSTAPLTLRTQPVMACLHASRYTKGRKPTPCTLPLTVMWRAIRSGIGGNAHAARPPDAAGAFVRHHARADRVAWGAGLAVDAALVGVDLAQHHLRAVATRRHRAGTAALGIGVVREEQARVVPREGQFQCVARARDDTDAAPVGVDDVERLFHHAARGGIAARMRDLLVAVVEEALAAL